MNLPKDRIFGIGLSRTGTSSLCSILNSLGIKCCHFPLGIFAHPQFIVSNYQFVKSRNYNSYSNWILDKERILLYKKLHLLESYQAFCDLPIPLYMEDLKNNYPDSYFIYTTRNVESWLKSMKWMLEEGPALWDWGEINFEILNQTYGTTIFKEDILRKKYLEHDEKVNQIFGVSNDRLLKINLDKGELTNSLISNFLGIPIPTLEIDTHLNKARFAPKSQKIRYSLKRNIPFLKIILNHINF